MTSLITLAVGSALGLAAALAHLLRRFRPWDRRKRPIKKRRSR